MNEKLLQDEGITSLRAQLPDIPPCSDNRLQRSPAQIPRFRNLDLHTRYEEITCVENLMILGVVPIES